MHDPERKALTRAALLLLVVSLARFSLDARPSASHGAAAEAGVGTGELDEHIAATEAAVDEALRRSRPLADGERIDPNGATAVELDRLPGVGPSTADAIVAARTDGTVFRSVEDLLAVRGIGPATLERMRSSLDLPAQRSATRRPRVVARVSDGVEGPSGEPAIRAVVDVNQADEQALRSLPGIGPALARRIVEARASEPFRTLDDLQRVRGIGPATVGRLRGRARAGPIR